MRRPGCDCVLVGADDVTVTTWRRKAITRAARRAGGGGHHREIALDAKADPSRAATTAAPPRFMIIPNNVYLLVPDAVETVPMLLRYGADVMLRQARHALQYVATTFGCKHLTRHDDAARGRRGPEAPQTTPATRRSWRRPSAALPTTFSD